MKTTPKFFKCTECSTLVEALNPQCCDEMTCCGKPMEMLLPNSKGEREEKHLPVVKRDGDTLTVCVGRILHPMTKNHSIKWIELVGRGFERRISLKSGDDPIVSFKIHENERLISVYAYCSVHGLWRTEIDV